MRICLSMIVRNEAPVIQRCLRSVRPFIDAWAICDTGSSDGTQKLVRIQAHSDSARSSLLLAEKFSRRDAEVLRAALPEASILDQSVYDWRARDELAVAAFACGDRPESVRIWRQLLAEARLPGPERARVQANLEAVTRAGT